MHKMSILEIERFYQFRYNRSNLVATKFLILLLNKQSNQLAVVLLKYQIIKNKMIDLIMNFR